MIRRAAILAAVALGACQVTVGVPGPIVYPTPRPDPDCGAVDFRWLVGRPASELGRVSFPGPVHIRRAGSAAPASAAGNRLVIVLDDSDKVIAVACD
jgi:hypothetical protein